MGLFQGLDTVPGEIFRDPVIRGFFRDFLPGWSGDGVYNFQPGAATQKIAAQLQIPLQNGSHRWINDAIKELFDDGKGNVNPRWLAANADEKTRMLSALVNFMHEASGPEAIANGGGKTGSFIAYSSRRNSGDTIPNYPVVMPDLFRHPTGSTSRGRCVFSTVGRRTSPGVTVRVKLGAVRPAPPSPNSRLLPQSPPRPSLRSPRRPPDAPIAATATCRSAGPQACLCAPAAPRTAAPRSPR